MRKSLYLVKQLYILFAVSLGAILFFVTVTVFFTDVMKGDFPSPISWVLAIIIPLLLFSANHIYESNKRKIEDTLNSLNFTASNGLQLFNPVSGKYFGMNLMTQKVVLISLTNKKDIIELPLNVFSGYELIDTNLILKFKDYDCPKFSVSHSTVFQDKLDVYFNS